MPPSVLTEYQSELVEQLEASGLNVSFGNDLSVLLKTYAVATGLSYAQLPFVLERPQDSNPYNFWVCFDDGNEPMALTAYRTLRNGSESRTVGRAFSQGALYRQSQPGREGWLAGSGPWLRPQALYGYIGAGWVHPRFRGHNLAGYIARIAQCEALIRTRGALAMSTAVTVEALFRSGMNLRASGLHHMHVEPVLDGYLQITDAQTRLHLSHSTGDELAEYYACELGMLRRGERLPWLHGHDKSLARSVLAANGGALVESELATEPVSTMAGLLA